MKSLAKQKIAFTILFLATILVIVPVGLILILIFIPLILIYIETNKQKRTSFLGMP